MTGTCRRISLASIVCIQILFLTVFFGFRDIPIAGSQPFRVLTQEEWEWLCQRQGAPYEGQVIAIASLFTTILGVTLFICCILHYWALFKNHRLQAADILIPIIGSVLSSPLSHYIKYDAEHYYLWMALVPLVVSALILLCLLLFDGRFRRTKPAP